MDIIKMCNNIVNKHSEYKSILVVRKLQAKDMSINFFTVFRYRQEDFLYMYVAAVTKHLLRSRLGD